MIAALTPFLLVLGPMALLVAMGIVFAETGLLVGFFLPGDSLLFTLGVLSAGGVLHLPFWVVAAGLLFAAVAGDQVGYLLGRRFGPRVFGRTDSRFFSTAHARRAQLFFAAHGPKAVVLARFVPVVRTFTPVVAGVARMPRRQFTAYNVAGAIVWTTGLLTVGFYLGGVHFIAANIELFAIGMVAASLIPALAGLTRRRLARHQRTSPSHRSPAIEASSTKAQSGSRQVSRSTLTV